MRRVRRRCSIFNVSLEQKTPPAAFAGFTASSQPPLVVQISHHQSIPSDGTAGDIDRLRLDSSAVISIDIVVSVRRSCALRCVLLRSLYWPTRIAAVPVPFTPSIMIKISVRGGCDALCSPPVAVDDDKLAVMADQCDTPSIPSKPAAVVKSIPAAAASVGCQRSSRQPVHSMLVSSWLPTLTATAGIDLTTAAGFDEIDTRHCSDQSTSQSVTWTKFLYRELGETRPSAIIHESPRRPPSHLRSH